MRCCLVCHFCDQGISPGDFVSKNILLKPVVGKIFRATSAVLGAAGAFLIVILHPFDDFYISVQQLTDYDFPQVEEDFSVFGRADRMLVFFRDIFRPVKPVAFAAYTGKQVGDDICRLARSFHTHAKRRE